MDNEIIKVTNSAYSQYEAVLLRREEVKKKAFHIEREYIRAFGDLILKVFKIKLECIRKKKTIDYCMTYLNRGKTVDQNALQEHLRREMESYEKQLEEMIRENELARNTGTVTESERIQIKKIYRRLAKQIHPDINPMTNSDEKLRGLWERLVIAYNCNDLEEMEELEFMVNSTLSLMNTGIMEISIPDIEEKIKKVEAEIEHIISTDPYQYIAILDDPDAVEEKKRGLLDEYSEYETYGNSLDNMLDKLISKGVSFTWLMN